MILPLCLKSSSIRHGLLSLASNPSERSPTDLYHYQMALTQLRGDIGAASGDNVDIEWIHQLLASSLILSFFNFSQCDGYSIRHIRGMISIVRMTDQALLASTPLGRFLMGVCSYHDISAFWIGRKQPSQRAWTSWMSHRTHTELGGDLTALESMMGYPESLVNIIADVAELVDDNIYLELENRADLNNGQFVSSFTQASPLAYGNASDELEGSLKRWAVPLVPQGLSPVAGMVLRSAWETFRLAAYLYLWRCFGFHANHLEPFRADRSTLARAHVTAIISNCEAILRLGSIPRVSIGNALLWPLAVAGCECGPGSDHDGQTILDMLQSLERLYSMEHPKYVRQALQKLWAAKGTWLNYQQTSADSARPPASLNQIVTEMKLVIPLL
ncbi:fungal-specific transcription factor domain-containing protein [Fusarium oxysporum]|nr:fungal-specific transcription factor domain-containing protein [Fusarium oxysporum]